MKSCLGGTQTKEKYTDLAKYEERYFLALPFFGKVIFRS